MPTYEEARNLIVQLVKPVGWERLPVLDALGRVVAEPVISAWDSPPFDNSAMDGYAVRVADCRAGGALPVHGALMAGDAATVPLEPGQATKIMTGAPLPAGVDAVIPFEEVMVEGDRITPTRQVTVGQHVRFRGEDLPVGAVVVAPSTVIRPAEISMLVSSGHLLIPVYRRVRVAILSTGDELVEPGEQLRPWTIINSNTLAL